MKKLIAAIAIIALAGMGAQAQEWGIFHTGTSFADMQAGIAAVNKSKGLIPVGISHYGDKTYFMFIKNKIGATGYFIQPIPKNASGPQLQGAIQSMISQGWVPFDLTISPDSIYVLHLKSKATINAWKIVSSGREWASLQETITGNPGYFPLGFTFDEKNAYTIIVNSPKSGITGWMIKNCGSNNSEINPAVEGMMGQGYTPYGFEFQGGQVGINFLK